MLLNYRYSFQIFDPTMMKKKKKKKKTPFDPELIADSPAPQETNEDTVQESEPVSEPVNNANGLFISLL